MSGDVFVKQGLFMCIVTVYSTRTLGPPIFNCQIKTKKPGRAWQFDDPTLKNWASAHEKTITLLCRFCKTSQSLCSNHQYLSNHVFFAKKYAKFVSSPNHCKKPHLNFASTSGQENWVEISSTMFSQLVMVNACEWLWQHKYGCFQIWENKITRRSHVMRSAVQTHWPKGGGCQLKIF